MTTATDVATSADYNIDGLDQLGQVWAEAAQGDPSFRPILPSLKVPSGGGTTWEDKDDASFEPRRELEAIILHSQVTTQLYLTDYEDSDESAGNRPDAWSDDGIAQIVPQETYAKVDALNLQNGWALPYPSTDLNTCPFNKFVDEPGAAIKPGQTAGKWNQEYHELYVVVRGAVDPVPFKVRVSPASIKAWAGMKTGYKNILQSRGVRLHTVETVLTLQGMKSGKIEYSEIHFRKGRNLEPTLMQRMGEIATGIREVVQGGVFSIGGQPLAQQIAAAQPVAALPAAPVAAIAAPVAVTPAQVQYVPAPVAPLHAPAPVAAPAPIAPAPVAVAAPVAPAPIQYAPVAAPVPVAPVVDPGVQNVADTFGATVVAPAPVAQAAPVAAPQPVPVPVAQAAPVAAPQIATPVVLPAPPAPAPVAAVAVPAGQPVPVAAAVGSGAAVEDEIDF